MNRNTVLIAAGALALMSAVSLVVRVAREERTDPARCPVGSSSMGARCCCEGQQLRGNHCVGVPVRCPAGMELQRGDRPGCVATVKRIRYSGGVVRVAPSDWEALGVVETRVVEVGPFLLDSTEVTQARWQACADAGACLPIKWREPGHVVRNVSPQDAAVFCRFDGGRLPTEGEWLFAATGRAENRFPWGPTGLVCRRAVFGLVAGPCARGGDGPELAGLRPDGATAEGVFDLAGNVAEWTLEPDGQYSARGGSYQSRVAAELKSWAVETTQEAASHIGFRCAYDAGASKR